MVTDDDRKLLEAALEAQKQAHCPFSRYPVKVPSERRTVSCYGMQRGGASFSLTCCGAVAVFKAVSEANESEACAIVTVEGKPAPPCGACRQVLFGFRQNMRIVLGNPEEVQFWSSLTCCPRGSRRSNSWSEQRGANTEMD